MNLTPNSLKQTKEKSKNDWCTPQWLFQKLHKIFDFEVDGAANDENKLLDTFYTKENPLRWPTVVHKRVFINPPFDKSKEFIELCHYHTSILSCLLLPFRPETKIWHSSIWPKANIFVFNKRIQYIHPDTKKEVKGAAFPSCLIFFGDISKYPIEKLNELGVFIKKVKDK